MFPAITLFAELKSNSSLLVSYDSTELAKLSIWLTILSIDVLDDETVSVSNIKTAIIKPPLYSLIYLFYHYQKNNTKIFKK